MKGKFITFEGGEGAGKGTQIKLLIARLEKEGLKIETSHEPGGTEIGKECRVLLKDIKYSPNKETELFLFEAARSEYVEKIVTPCINKGTHFISDRFSDSTLVYQGLVREIPLDQVIYCNKIASKGLIPDLTIVLDVNAEEGVEKALEQARFEKEGLEFHKKINQFYRELPERFPERNIIVIPRKEISEVHELVYQEIKKII